MKKKDIFTLTISTIAILLLLVTPINTKIKEMGNQITGFAVEDLGTTTSEIIPETTESPDLDLTDENIQKAASTSESLRTPQINSILSKLQLSSTEKLIIKELAGNYLEDQAKISRYTPAQLVVPLPKQLKLSIPAKNTDVILAVKDQKPQIKINIKA